ncbi:hypothetical protein [Streptomyces hawaiiensis]|nr:hypothetical protein [Streptomyces hawaiiensis]
MARQRATVPSTAATMSLATCAASSASAPWHGGVKRLHHPQAGFLELTYQPLDLPVSAHEAHSLTIYTAEPGTAYEDRLQLLASWAATGLEAADPAGGGDR